MWNIILGTLILISGFVFGYKLGHFIGFRRGADDGWSNALYHVSHEREERRKAVRPKIKVTITGR